MGRCMVDELGRYLRGEELQLNASRVLSLKTNIGCFRAAEAPNVFNKLSLGALRRAGLERLD